MDDSHYDSDSGARQDNSHDAHLAQLISLLGKSSFAMLVTMSPDGTHHSRPMTVQEAEFDGDLWFFADDTSSYVTGQVLSVSGGLTMVG